jgi:hypothetical protein
VSLDATEVKLTKTGSLQISPDGEVYLTGFVGSEGCTCRDVATLALVWAIGKLQKDLKAQIEKPGGSGNVAID